MQQQADNETQQLSETRRDWTQGSILKNLLLLSWPIVVMELLFATSQLVDMIWVGRLGSNAIAGAGIANIILLVLMSVDMGLFMGSRAVIARCIGVKDQQGANHYAGQIIAFGAFWGAIITATGVTFAENMIGLFDVSPEVLEQGTMYLRTMFAGWISMEVLVMCLYSIQSSGDTMKPMIVEVIIRAVHLTLCPCLVLGLWIFPSMGVSGAALSNVISQCLGAIILLTILLKGRTRLHLALRDFKPVPASIWRILKISIPAVIMQLQKTFGELLLARIITPFGTLAIAAHSLVFKVEMFLSSLPYGIGGGSGVLVGQNLGAGQPKRAEKSGWLALAIVESFIVICCIALLIWAEPVMSIFTNEPDLLEIGSTFLRIATLTYIMLAIVNVLQFAIAGAGDTLPTMIFSIISTWIVQLPLAYFLPQLTNLGVYGVRWAMVGGMTVGAIMYITYFLIGRWKSKKV